MKGMRIVGMAVVIGVIALIGCAEGTTPAGPDCQSDDECAEGEVCDTALGICEEPRGASNDDPSNDDNDDPSNDDNQNDEPTNGDNDDNDDNQNNDNGDNDENGDNDDNQNNDNGDPIDPPDNDTEPANQDDPVESCTEEFVECVPGDADSGQFLCLELPEDDDMEGICVRECAEPGHAGSCTEETYCFELDGEPDTSICFPSECEQHADCTDPEGTCIRLDNDFGFCFEDGDGQEGATCSGGPGGECGHGMVCDAADGQTGQCSTVCSPWEATECAMGQHCTVGWERTGLCTDQQTSMGTAPYDTCNPSQAWCADATTCMEGDTDNFCIKYCRPGYGDCTNLSMDSVCDPNFALGFPEIGACFPPCDGDADCGDGVDCVGDYCRLSCTQDSECCPDDDPDCPAECDTDGYCI